MMKKWIKGKNKVKEAKENNDEDDAVVEALTESIKMWKAKVAELEKKIELLETEGGRRVIRIDNSAEIATPGAVVAIPGALSVGEFIPIENDEPDEPDEPEEQKIKQVKEVEGGQKDGASPVAAWVATNNASKSIPVVRGPIKCAACNKVMGAPYATVGVNQSYVEVCSPACQREARNKMFSSRRRR